VGFCGPSPILPDDVSRRQLDRSVNVEDDIMLVSEIMSRAVESIGPDDTLQDAAMRMKECGVGPLPVCENQCVVGMVTDRDITLRAVAEGLDPATTPVRDVMSAEIVCCFDDQEVEVAARLMQSKQIRRVLVLDRDKKLVGIVTLGDLAAEAVDTQRAGEILHQVSEAAPQS
jgi:CBS domain-containing protein